MGLSWKPDGVHFLDLLAAQAMGFRIHSSVVFSQRSVVLDLRGTFVKPRPRVVSDIMNACHNLLAVMHSIFPKFILFVDRL